MGFTFRPAKRENVSLIVGLIGSTGSGKTYSAMELASGIADGKPFGFVGTEARRALHYADRFRFEYGELTPPFRPDRYHEAIMAADKAGYPVIVVDSVSHEHAGEGGLLDWHEEELQRMAGNDFRKRETCNMAAWIKPKMSHKAWVQRLLQVRAHLILCFRAEEKVKMARDAKGKMQIVPQGWQPVCEKNLPYELTCSLLLTDDEPGVPKPIKLQAQHKHLFSTDHVISRDSGKALAEWARAGDEPPKRPAIIDDIEAALSLEALEAVAKAIKDAYLEGDDLRQTRDAYKRRAAQLGWRDGGPDNIDDGPPGDEGVPG